RHTLFTDRCQSLALALALALALGQALALALALALSEALALALAPGPAASGRRAARGLGLEQPQDAGDGNRDPVRPVVELVPELVVAVMPDQLAHRAELGQQTQPLADVLALAGDRYQRLVVRRQLGEHGLDLVVDRRRQQRQRLGARLFGVEGRVARLRAKGAV